MTPVGNAAVIALALRKWAVARRGFGVAAADVGAAQQPPNTGDADLESAGSRQVEFATQ